MINRQDVIEQGFVMGELPYPTYKASLYIAYSDNWEIWFSEGNEDFMRKYGFVESLYNVKLVRHWDGSGINKMNNERQTQHFRGWVNNKEELLTVLRQVGYK